jgi:hypothetical protein
MMSFIMAVLCIFVGAWAAIRSVLDPLRSSSWPTAAGRITVSEVITVTNSDEGNTFQAVVAYTFQVQGKSFSGDEPYFGSEAERSWISFARRVQRRYPVGSAVTVYYDPEDPNKSVLQRRISGSLMFAFLAGVTVVLMGVYVLFHSR